MTDTVEQRRLRVGPLAAILITIASFFGSQLVAGLVVGYGPRLFGFKSHQIQTWFDTAILPQTITVSLAALGTLLILKWYLRRKGDSFQTLGLGNIRLIAAAQAVLGFAVYLG